MQPQLATSSSTGDPKQPPPLLQPSPQEQQQQQVVPPVLPPPLHQQQQQQLLSQNPPTTTTTMATTMATVLAVGSQPPLASYLYQLQHQQPPQPFLLPALHANGGTGSGQLFTIPSLLSPSSSSSSNASSAAVLASPHALSASSGGSSASSSSDDALSLMQLRYGGFPPKQEGDGGTTAEAAAPSSAIAPALAPPAPAPAPAIPPPVPQLQQSLQLPSLHALLHMTDQRQSLPSASAPASAPEADGKTGPRFFPVASSSDNSSNSTPTTATASGSASTSISPILPVPTQSQMAAVIEHHHLQMQQQQNHLQQQLQQQQRLQLLHHHIQQQQHLQQQQILFQQQQQQQQQQQPVYLYNGQQPQAMFLQQQQQQQQQMQGQQASFLRPFPGGPALMASTGPMQVSQPPSFYPMYTGSQQQGMAISAPQQQQQQQHHQRQQPLQPQPVYRWHGSAPTSVASAILPAQLLAQQQQQQLNIPIPTSSPSPPIVLSSDSQTATAADGTRYVFMDAGRAMHLRKSGGRSQCHICGHVFTRPSSLATHMNAHTGERPFVCPFPNCNKRFSVQSNMRRHARTTHIGQTLPQSTILQSQLSPDHQRGRSPSSSSSSPSSPSSTANDGASSKGLSASGSNQLPPILSHVKPETDGDTVQATASSPLSASSLASSSPSGASPQ